HFLRLITVLGFSRLIWTSKDAEQTGSIEEDVDITCARDLDARNFLDVFEVRLELFRDCARRLFLARGLFDQLGEFERDGEGEVAEFGARRRFGRELLHLNAKQFAGSAADPVSKFLL